MKKIMLAIVAVSALATGGAFAQAPDNYYPNGIRGNSGWTPDGGNYQGIGSQPDPASPNATGAYGWGGAGAILSQGIYGSQYGYRTPYERTNRDRDGDGVRNNRDRHPDDPRYR